MEYSITTVSNKFINTKMSIHMFLPVVFIFLKVVFVFLTGNGFIAAAHGNIVRYFL